MRPDLLTLRRLRVGSALLAVAVGTSACKPLDDLMAVVFGRHMRISVAFDPYENPRLPDSTAVSFASGNYPAAPGQVNLGEPEGLEEDLPPMTQGDLGSEMVNTLVNPVPADSASLARGQVVYERMCAVCHGPAGLSADAPILAMFANGLMANFNLATGNAVGFTDGYVYAMIRVGRGLMPAYGHRVTHFDRWHIVNYVRELQRRAGQTPAAGGGAPGAGADTAGAAAGGGI
jgi:mono/diheme cytochrome c family protein